MSYPQQRQRHFRKCVGFGPYEGTCENKAGTKWSPNWCYRCETLRQEHLNRQFAAIEAKLHGDAPPVQSAPTG